jgi:exosortase C (VPDSG-CTERM-specific)
MKRDRVSGSVSPVSVVTRLPVGDMISRSTGTRLRSFGGFVVFVALIGWLFSGTLAALFQHALSRDLHSHIILIPFVSAYLIFLKRAELEPLPCGLPLVGGAIVLTGLVGAGLLTIFAQVGWSENDLLAAWTSVILILLLGGAVGFLGWRWLRVITFPVALLVFVIPLPDAAVAGLERVLVAASAEVSHWMFLLSGTPVFRDGHSLHIPGIVLEVARECSGIRSTWVLVITSMIAAYLFLQNPWYRTLLIAIVLPLGIIRNALRIWVIGLLCVHLGPEMIHSWVHHRGGPVFFAGSLVPLCALGWFLRKRELR